MPHAGGSQPLKSARRAVGAASRRPVCDHGVTMMNPKTQKSIVVVLVVLVAVGLVMGMVLSPASI